MPVPEDGDTVNQVSELATVHAAFEVTVTVFVPPVGVSLMAVGAIVNVGAAAA